MLGSGTIGGVVLWMLNRRKGRAEADLTEVQVAALKNASPLDMAKEAMDMGLKLFDQVKVLREENDQHRSRIIELESQVRHLQDEMDECKEANRKLERENARLKAAAKDD